MATGGRKSSCFPNPRHPRIPPVSAVPGCRHEQAGVPDGARRPPVILFADTSALVKLYVETDESAGWEFYSRMRMRPDSTIHSCWWTLSLSNIRASRFIDWRTRSFR